MAMRVSGSRYTSRKRCKRSSLQSMRTLLLLLYAAACGAQAVTPVAPSPTADTLSAYTACFARELGAAPRWSIVASFTEDSASHNYGTTVTYAVALEAYVTYNLWLIQHDKKPLRELALHEVLHVVSGELGGLASGADRKFAEVEWERLVRQMVRWPVWSTMCAPGHVAVGAP